MTLIQPADEVFFEQCANEICETAGFMLTQQFQSIRRTFKLDREIDQPGKDAIEQIKRDLKERFLAEARCLLGEGKMTGGREADSHNAILLMAQSIADPIFVIGLHQYTRATAAIGGRISEKTRARLTDEPIYEGYKFNAHLAVPLARILERRMQRLAEPTV